MDKNKTIEALQFFITNLNAQAFSHKLQAYIFKSKGYEKLSTLYLDHSNEELGYVDRFIERLLDLGGTLKQEKIDEQILIEDPVEYIKSDNKVSVDGIEFLRKCMDTIKDDYTTFDIFKAYLKDEEDDMYWQEEQLDLIEKIGVQNWLMTKAI